MKTKLIHLAAAAITAVVVVASCQNVSTPLANPKVDLVGPTWQLVAFEEDGDRTSIDRSSGNIPEHAYTITFTRQPAQECISNEKSEHGSWCTELTGYPNTSPSTTYDLNTGNDQSLTIYFRGTTFINVPPESRELEFFAAIDAAASYRIDGRQLHIFYDDEKALLFEPLKTGE